MGEPHRFETAGRRSPDPEVSPEPKSRPKARGNGQVEKMSGPEELKVRLAIKNRHIQELYEELAGARLSADEVRAVREVGQREISGLEEERDLLQRLVQELEENLQRESDRRPELERALGEREAEVAELREKLEEEYELRGRLAEPENRLRAGIELFNESEHRDAVSSLSRSLGQPEVHVALDDGDEPAVSLDFTWQGITWQTYAANPGLAAEEPRVYLSGSGEDLSGVERERPNAHVGAAGRVFLGM
ncbi:hypothetical protein BH24ACT22_BH24ACT22_19140 [soil metagenome]